MEGNTGFVWFCFPPLRCSQKGYQRKGKDFFNQKQKKQPLMSVSKVASWCFEPILFCYPYILGGNDPNGKGKQPPTAAVFGVDEIHRAPFEDPPKKNTPDASYRFQLTLPFHWRGSVLKGILREWYIFIYLPWEAYATIFDWQVCEFVTFLGVVSEWKRDPN